MGDGVYFKYNGTKRLSPELNLPEIPIRSSDEIYYTLGAPDEFLLNMQLLSEINQMVSSPVGFAKDYKEYIDPKGSGTLKIVSRSLTVIDILIQGAVSAYSNFNDESLSDKEKWIGFGEDVIFDIVAPLVASGIAGATIGKFISWGLAYIHCPPLLAVVVTTVAVAVVAAIIMAIFNHVFEEMKLREQYRAFTEENF